MIHLICPVCGSPLEICDGSYKCLNRHCFDLSRSGYVNLLPSSGPGKRHGDDKLMVRARTEFLNRGYYDPLSREICSVIDRLTGNAPDIIDAGCGEGKYTADLQQTLLNSGKTPDILGVDISKDALVYASRRSRTLKLTVASTSALPVSSGSVDVILNIFSPFMEEEFARVLKPHGIMVRVFPLEDHLWELKSAVYDTPYKNDPLPEESSGFHILDRIDVCYSIQMDRNEDIQALFKMTPYYYKTGVRDQKKLELLDRLTTRLEFRIVVYERI